MKRFSARGSHLEIVRRAAWCCLLAGIAGSCATGDGSSAEPAAAAREALAACPAIELNAARGAPRSRGDDGVVNVGFRAEFAVPSNFEVTQGDRGRRSVTLAFDDTGTSTTVVCTYVGVPAAATRTDDHRWLVPYTFASCDDGSAGGGSVC